MHLTRYLLGVALLLAVAGACGWGSVRLRRRLLPGWDGAPGRLCDAVIALGLVIGVAEVLGIVGLLRLIPFVGGCLLAALAAGIAGRPRDIDGRPTASSPTLRWEVIVALGAGALVAGHWATAIGQAFHGGMLGPDTLAYHGPIAATFVQRGSIVHPPRVYADPAVAFYPAVSELVHALGILSFSRDVISPLINLGWLALALLAAWCIGRPRRVGWVCVLVVAVVIDTPVFSTSQPGSADNDVMGLALLLASLAILFRMFADSGGHSARVVSPQAIALAGLAAGLAIGTKLAFVAPLGLITIVVLLLATGKRERLGWCLGLASSCAVWFGRNTLAFGNPIPALHLGVGPLALPAASLPPSSTVFGSLGVHGIWTYLFIPGLKWAFTFMWPVLLGLALLGAVVGAVAGASRLERLLAATALLAAVAYSLTPRTNDGLFFQFNLRYLVPALLIGLLLLVRATSRWARWRAGALALLAFALAVWMVADLRAGPHFGRTSIVAAAAVMAAGLGWLASLRHERRMLGALLALAVAALLLWPTERTYLRTRYVMQGLTACELIPCGPLAFARDGHHLRIAIFGGLGPYPLYGSDLSNTVVDIERHGSHGSWAPIRTCTRWRDALAAGHYQYVVTSNAYYLFSPGSAVDANNWTRGDPSARLLSTTTGLFRETVTVFRLTGSPNRATCAR